VRYKRPPDCLSLSPMVSLYENAEGMVAMGIMDPSEPIVINGLTLIARGYLGVFYVSSSEWHDVGAVYDTNRTFMGYYSDIATPMKRLSDGYTMTDLFLDLWVFPDGRHVVLDQDQFVKAVTEGWLNNNQIKRAKTELENLIKAVKSKKFPPPKIKKLIKLPENVDEIASTLQRLQCTVRHIRVG